MIKRSISCRKQRCGDRNSQGDGNDKEFISNILGEIENVIICRRKELSGMQSKKALDSGRKCLGKILYSFSYLFTKYFLCAHHVPNKIRCCG